jgi:hypothetical protein
MVTIWNDEAGVTNTEKKGSTSWNIYGGCDKEKLPSKFIISTKERPDPGMPRRR